MDATRKLPLWAWWVIGLAAIVVVSAIIVISIRNRGPVLPPGLVEKRNAVAKIFEESSRLEDVDIRPLTKLEAEKNYRGAVALMESALAANTNHAMLNASLVTLSDDLTTLAVGVRPDAIGAKAIEAFGLLNRLAQAEKKFYEDRQQLYAMTRDYYAGFLAKQNPPIPASLRPTVEAVGVDLEKAKTLHQQFTAAVKAFDEAVSRQ